MKFKNYLDKKFKITQRGSSIKTEFMAGLINFLVTSYVMIVIPSILLEGNVEVTFNALFIGTIISIVVCTFSIGIFANTPLMYAPGIGIASYVMALIASGTYDYNQLLVIVLASGIVFVLITVFKLRDKLINAIPDFIKDSMPIGIGLFIAMLALGSSNSGILDLMSYGPLFATSGGQPVWIGTTICLVSLCVIMCLYLKNVKGSIFFGIIAGTVVSLIIQICQGINPFAVLGSNWLPNFGEFFNVSLFKFDFAGVFSTGSSLLSSILTFVIIVYSFTLVDVFDTIGTVIGASKRGNLIKDGKVENMNRIMYVDSLSSVLGATIGVPTCTAYVESTAGIESGGRTGLTSIFTSIFFLLCLFISPIVKLIPTSATAGALIFVGILMFSNIKDLKLDSYYTTIPTFFTILLMPLTGNISYGIAGGLISYTAIMLFTGKGKQVNIFTYICSILFIIFFATQGIL